jgi:putative oxidoreductase
VLWNSLDRYRDSGLLIARLGFGLGFLWYHGLPKLKAGRDGWSRTGEAMANFGINFGIEWWGLAAALAEGIGGLLIALGLCFRPAALAVLMVMIVASTNHIVTRGHRPTRLKTPGCSPVFFLSAPVVTAWIADSH